MLTSVSPIAASSLTRTRRSVNWPGVLGHDDEPSSERVLITTRRMPVHSLELTRRSIEAGRRFPTPMAFLDGIIDQFADVICRLSETLADHLDDAERRLMKEEVGDDARNSAACGCNSRTCTASSCNCTCCSSASSRASLRKTSRSRALRALAQKLDAIDHDVAA